MPFFDTWFCLFHEHPRCSCCSVIFDLVYKLLVFCLADLVASVLNLVLLHIIHGTYCELKVCNVIFLMAWVNSGPDASLYANGSGTQIGSLRAQALSLLIPATDRKQVFFVPFLHYNAFTLRHYHRCSHVPGEFQEYSFWV